MTRFVEERFGYLFCGKCCSKVKKKKQQIYVFIFFKVSHKLNLNFLNLDLGFNLLRLELGFLKCFHSLNFIPPIS